jgi:hypothetical protein
VSEICIPGERQQDRFPHEMFELTEMSGRPCMVTIDGSCLAVWLLTADRQWEQACTIRDNKASTHCRSINGVWDCGGVC